MNHDVYNSPFKNFVLQRSTWRNQFLSNLPPCNAGQSDRAGLLLPVNIILVVDLIFYNKEKNKMFWIFSLVLKILIQNINRWHPEVGKTAAPNLRNIRPQVAKPLSWFTPINLSTLINLDQPEHLAQPEHLDHLDQPEHLDHLYHLDQPEHTQIEHVNRNFTPSKG